MIIGKKLLLAREKEHFHAGFGIVGENLEQLSKKTHLLHPEEAAYYKSLQFDKRKTSYLLGRISAKEAVKVISKKELEYQRILVKAGVFQFPVVKNTDQNIQVSISHTDHLGVSVAFPEEHPLGIDIERIDYEKADVIATTLTNKEKAFVRSYFVKIPIGYTVLWTIKESLSKIIKTGFTSSPEIFEIKSVKKTGNQVICDFENFFQYKSISYILNNHVCSMAVPRKTEVDCSELWNSLKIAEQL